MQVGADPHQGSARGRGGEETGIDAVPAPLEPGGTVGVGQKITPVESVDINGERRRLQPQDEMARHADASHREAKPAGHKQVHQAEAERVAQTAVDHPVQVAVLRVVIVGLVAPEMFLPVQDTVDRHQCRRLALRGIAHLAHRRREFIDLGLVRFQVQIGKGSAGEQPDAFLEVELLPAPVAKGDEFPVSFAPFQLREDGPAMFPDEPIPAPESGLQPRPRLGAAVDQGLPDGMEHPGVGIGQQPHQRRLVLPGKRGKLHRVCQQSLHQLVRADLITRPPGWQPGVIHMVQTK